MSRAAGGQNVINKQDPLALDLYRTADGERAAEIFLALGAGQADLPGGPFDFSQQACGAGNLEMSSPGVGKDFRGARSVNETVRPEMGDGDDKIDGFSWKAVGEIIARTFREGSDEPFARSFFSQEAGGLQVPFIDTPADDPIEGKFFIVATWAEILRFEVRAERFAATGTLVFPDVSVKSLGTGIAEAPG